MKKYLLIIISLVCAVTGAWAEVSYPYNFESGSSVDWDATNSILTVTIGTTGDFATFTSMLRYAEGNTNTVSPIKLTHIRIKCTGSATISETEVTSMNTAKADNIYTSLDLTDAAFDTDEALSTLLGKGVNYVALPKGKSISDVTLKDDTTIKGVVTSASDGSNAAYTAYNGSDNSSNFIFLKQDLL